MENRNVFSTTVDRTLFFIHVKEKIFIEPIERGNFEVLK